MAWQLFFVRDTPVTMWVSMILLLGALIAFAITLLSLYRCVKIASAASGCLEGLHPVLPLQAFWDCPLQMLALQQTACQVLRHVQQLPAFKRKSSSSHTSSRYLARLWAMLCSGLTTQSNGASLHE